MRQISLTTDLTTARGGVPRIIKVSSVGFLVVSVTSELRIRTKANREDRPSGGVAELADVLLFNTILTVALTDFILLGRVSTVGLKTLAGCLPLILGEEGGAMVADGRTIDGVSI